MDSVDARAICGWCEAKPGAVLEHPFGPEAAVFKVRGKMFALVAMDGPPDYVTLKADPEEGERLRAQHVFIREGYYMNKRHWITIDLGPSVSSSEVDVLTRDSYELVVATVAKKVRIRLGLVDG
jgi:predicted DNA-binding protein (MmcQ/YjbR family)